jgi:hypothetical protein
MTDILTSCGCTVVINKITFAKKVIEITGSMLL